MISRYEVSLNQTSLSSIHPSILIHDINYISPEISDETVTLAKRNGSFLQRRYFGTSVVEISFEIHEYSTRVRQEICKNIVLWAKKGGQLETSDKEGQFLQCVCTKFPVIESARNWTDPLTVEFTAYVIPFWQEKNMATLAITGTSGNGSLFVPGNADDVLVSASIKANSAISSVSLTVNGRTLSLTGLSVSSGSTIEIAYDGNAIQSIKVGNTSLLNNRSGVDDLLAKSGELNTFSISASASVTVTFKIRGWSL